MDKLDIFSYATFAEYLADYVKARKATNPAYSYMVLARQIGSKSPSLLTQIGLGNRQPTPNLLHKLKDALKLNKKEYEYALALVGLQRAKGPDERAFYSEKLRKLKPSNPSLIQELDRHDFFGKWFNVVILEMVRLADFRAEPSWIASRLGHKITAEEASEALDLLTRLRLININTDGRAMAVVEEHTATPIDFPSATVREFHKQMMQQAAEALDSQSVNERYIAGTSISIDASRVAEAQEAIREFRRKFCEDFQSKAGTETYHFAAQLFRVTCSRPTDQN